MILVDTGANAGLKALPRWHPYFRFAVRFDIEREQEVGPQLRALGIAPRDVKTVVLTHLHMDHDGGLKDFVSSEILVSPGELRAASGLAGQIRGYLPQRWPSGFDPKPLALADEAYGPFPRSRRLTADGRVVAIPTPGHTPDHISIVIEDGDVAVVLAGDASYTEANLIAGNIDGVSESEAAGAGKLGAASRICDVAADDLSADPRSANAGAPGAPPGAEAVASPAAMRRSKCAVAREAIGT